MTIWPWPLTDATQSLEKSLGITAHQKTTNLFEPTMDHQLVRKNLGSQISKFFSPKMQSRFFISNSIEQAVPQQKKYTPEI